MSKQLEIGKDYGGIFFDHSKGKMIYLGGNEWELVRPDGATQMKSSEKVTAQVLNIINRPAAHMAGGKQL